MNKSYTFNIKNCIYSVDIKNNIMKIYNIKCEQIGNDIEIAYEYANDESIVRALVDMEISSIKDKEENESLINDALKKLGITQ